MRTQATQTEVVGIRVRHTIPAYLNHTAHPRSSRSASGIHKSRDQHSRQRQHPPRHERDRGTRSAGGASEATTIRTESAASATSGPTIKTTRSITSIRSKTHDHEEKIQMERTQNGRPVVIGEKRFPSSQGQILSQPSSMERAGFRDTDASDIESEGSVGIGEPRTHDDFTSPIPPQSQSAYLHSSTHSIDHLIQKDEHHGEIRDQISTKVGDTKTSASMVCVTSEDEELLRQLTDEKLIKKKSYSDNVFDETTGSWFVVDSVDGTAKHRKIAQDAINQTPISGKYSGNATLAINLSFIKFKLLFLAFAGDLRRHSAAALFTCEPLVEYIQEPPPGFEDYDAKEQGEGEEEIDAPQDDYCEIEVRH